MEVVFALGGVILGFGLSVFFWWYLNHRLVPSVAWSDAISKRLDPSTENAVYRVMFENDGSRDIVDLRCRARVYLPSISNLVPPVPRTVRIVNINLKIDHLFILRSKKNRILNLQLAETDLGYLPSQEERIRRGLNGSLEALLSFHSSSYLRFQILAYDSFSGARQCYESPKYTAADVKFGVFKDMSVVEYPSLPTVADGIEHSN